MILLDPILIPARRAWRDWDRFWFAPQTARVLGLYRIVIGVMTLYTFALFAKDAGVFFSDAGVLTVDALHRAMLRDWHITILEWARSPAAVAGVLAALFAAGILFTIGLWTRASAIVLYVLVLSFHERNNFVLNSGDTTLRCLLFFFMFAPAGAAFSVDSLLRRLRRPEEEDAAPVLIAPWAQRMMQAQVAVIYFVTAYAKSRGGLWHNGHALYYVLGQVDYHLRGVEQLMNFPTLYSSLTFATLFAEIALPFLLWFRASRPWAVLIGVLLHGWIVVFMTLPVFGTLMLCTYIPFFAEDQLDGLIDRVRRRFAGGRARLFYDGACPLCRRTRRVVRILDLFDRAEFVDVRTAPPAERPPGRDEAALLAEMHLVTADGRVLAGFHAFRWLALRLPVTFWLAPLLHLPGVPAVGARVYGWVARNRVIQVACPEDGACRVHGTGTKKA